ncbi:MAG: hypothetical protein ACFE7E_00295 [Candidatus Hodarchaeota archaeon]
MELKGVHILAIGVVGVIAVGGVVGVILLTQSDGTFASLTQGTGNCMQSFTPIFDGLLSVLEEVDWDVRILRNNTSINKASIPWRFSVDQDYNGDSLGDTRINGTISPGIGTVLGSMGTTDNAVFAWSNYAGVPPDPPYSILTAWGTFTFVKLSSDTFRMTIVAETIVYTSATCWINFTGFDLYFNLSAYIQGYAPYLDMWEFADPWVGVYTGNINFVTTRNSDTLVGMMTFDGSNIATVTGNYMGSDYTFTIDLETFAVTIV